MLPRLEAWRGDAARTRELLAQRGDARRFGPGGGQVANRSLESWHVTRQAGAGVMEVTLKALEVTRRDVGEAKARASSAVVLARIIIAGFVLACAVLMVTLGLFVWRAAARVNRRPASSRSRRPWAR